MKIDFHCHAWPEPYLRAFKEFYPEVIELNEDPQGKLSFGSPGARIFLSAWDPQQRLEDMDKAKVDVGILSMPSIYTRVDGNSPKLCRIVNDVLAESCKRYRDRFKAYAHIPFNSIEDALQEMARCIDELHFAGVVIASNIGGRYPHIPDFLPFWQAVSRRKVPVFMHPIDPPNYQDDELSFLLAYPAETTLATTKLLYAGLFQHFPNLILILPHLGGTLPYLARRIDLAYEQYNALPKYGQIPYPPSEYLSKLYLDTGLCWHRPAFQCAQELVGIDHILYGTDQFMPGSPWMQRTNEFIEGLGLTPLEREKIYCRNAQRLLNL